MSRPLTSVRLPAVPEEEHNGAGSVNRSVATVDMRVAFLSHTAMGGSLVVGSHQLAREFAREGHDVSHISAPLSIAHLGLLLWEPFIRMRLRRWLAGGESIGGVLDMVPFTLLPWHAARLSRRLMNSYSRHMLSAPMHGVGALKLDAADCLIVDEPRLLGLANSKRGRLLIYRATDLYALMRSDPSIVEAERALCSRADLLIATSEPVAAHLRRISGRNVRVIANGVEIDHFASSSMAASSSEFRLPGRREDRAIYAGAFDRRFGRDALRAAAEKLPQKQFILVGPGSQVVAAATARSNVTALGAVDYQKLPAVLGQCTVGMLPMSSDISNSGRSPMKLYEYAAAGLTVAATSTEELRRCELATLCLADGHLAFYSAVSDAFARAQVPSMVAAGRAAAQRESWEVKAKILLDLMCYANLSLRTQHSHDF